jgi:hypothetical protein
MFCHAIFAFFCVQLPIGDSTAAMENMGFGGVTTIETQKRSAFLGMGTDAPVQMNSKKLATFCDANKKCVSYWRHCDGTKFCEFDFALSGTTIPVRVTFKGGDMHALDAIGVAIDPDKPNVGTPLSALTVESSETMPPTCDNPKEDCPKS